MSISFAGLVAAQVSFMRMFGVGLVLAVLVDATLVRMVLLPAFMHLLGRWNWWAPNSTPSPCWAWWGSRGAWTIPS
jgi:RND superfamily putative drug exporter